MSPIEIALVVLISIWSIIFIILGVALVYLVFQIRRALDKINQIVDNAESFTEEVRSSLRSVAAGLGALTAKGIIGTVVKGVSRMTSSGNKK